MSQRRSVGTEMNARQERPDASVSRPFSLEEVRVPANAE